MRTPTTTNLENLDATLLAPQTGEVTRFKATLPVSGVADRMLAPLYAEMLERGTKSKARKQFAEALETLGAQITVSSDRFGVTITGCALSETFPAFLKLLSEMLREPAFAQKESAQVHKHYLQALDDEDDDARTRAYNGFTQTLYPKGHPYYRPTATARRTHLKSVTRKAYLDFHKRIFAVRMSEKISTSVSGTPKVQKELLGLFSSLTKGGTADIQTESVIFPHKEKTTYQSVPGKTNIELYIGNTLPLTLADPAFLPFQFGLVVLGKWGGFSGRLMSSVREKEGLTYTIYARTDGVTKTHSGMWYIFTFFTPKDLERGIASTRREIKTIAEKGVTEKETACFKELLKNQFILAHESDAKALALYHDALCSGMTAQEVSAQYDAMQKLERKDVNEVLMQYLQVDSLVISGAGPVHLQKLTGRGL